MEDIKHSQHVGNVSFFIPHEGCPRDCSFCNQRTISGTHRPPTPTEVKQTLHTALENLGEKAPLTEIAFFGGSFTAIQKELQHSLLQAATPFCGVIGEKKGFAGIRFSTRPDAITPEILTELKEYPVVHIELGAQSMDTTVLTANQRGHTPQATLQASRWIKEAGYGLTLQMMTGLYRDTPEKCKATAQALADLAPDSVRIYPTVVLENTGLAALYRAGEYIPPTLEETIDCCGELLLFFHQQNIPVIRLGLHSSDMTPNQILAGAYHPALRELCTGRALVALIENEVKYQNLVHMPYGVEVSPKELSSLTGHGRQALEGLRKVGLPNTIRTNNELSTFEVLVEPIRTKKPQVLGKEQ